jgi:signal transduction histidine kinase
VKVEIEDTGTGIEPSETDRIFNPFYTTRAGGTGLGLALAHKIVQDHGGRISFTSASGRGTTFTIVLPLVAEPPIAAEDSR